MSSRPPSTAFIHIVSKPPSLLRLMTNIEARDPNMTTNWKTSVQITVLSPPIAV
jgi:hypothetical protein